MYGVDLLCRGVTHTLYRYNEPEEELRDILANSKQHYMNFEKTQYNLVHNIIYAAIEFAEEYGFKPVSEFTRVTQYFLEEDNENIPLIEIHCGGENGKPLYINTGEDSPAKEQQVLAKLDKTAGPGNYDYILHDDFEDEDDDDDYDDDDDDYDDDDDDDDDYDDDDENEEDEEHERLKDTFRVLDEEDLKSRYLELVYETSKDKDAILRRSKEFIAMTEVIVNNNTDMDNVSNYLDELKMDVICDVVGMFDLPNSFFAGLQTDDSDKVEEIYNEIYDMLNNGQDEKAFKKFRKELGDIPLLYYLKLTNMSIDDDKSTKEYNAKLEEYYQKFPDYFLFQILHYFNLDSENELKTLLSSKKEPVIETELLEFLFAYIKITLNRDFIPERVAAFTVMARYFYEEYDIDIRIISMYLLLAKIDMAKKICGYNEWLEKKENNNG
jgi:hypothetical protein